MTTYVEALREAHVDALASDDDVVVIGQGLWSPWYVGASMTDLDKTFGKERIVDTPVSEQATTGAGVGAALAGLRPIVVHPRVDFAMLAMDQIVTQAAKWSSMFGGRSNVPVVFRLIINRGGEQGAQHSQSLFSWFSHVPGLRVVSPATPSDAYALLRASVDCPDPVVFMDDRWMYEQEDPDLDLKSCPVPELETVRPNVLVEGTDVTIVAHGHSTKQAVEAAELLASDGVAAEVVDLRVLNPIDNSVVVESVRRTGRLMALDGDWLSCGISSEVIAATSERLHPSHFRCAPRRLGLPPVPAPTSRVLESAFYPTSQRVADEVLTMMKAMS